MQILPAGNGVRDTLGRLLGLARIRADREHWVLLHEKMSLHLVGFRQNDQPGPGETDDGAARREEEARVAPDRAEREHDNARHFLPVEQVAVLIIVGLVPRLRRSQMNLDPSPVVRHMRLVASKYVWINE